MKDLRILFISVGLLICLALTSCTISKDGANVGSLVGNTASYWAENNKWPKDEKELRAFTENEGIDFDWSKFSRIKFTPQADGGVLIEAEAAPPSSAKHSITLQIPKEIKKAGKNIR